LCAGHSRRRNAEYRKKKKEKKVKKVATPVLALIGLTLGSYAFAQNTDTKTANATARIITPISLSKTADLNFGDVVPSGALGTVVVSPAGVRSATGGASLGSGAAVTAAAFTVSGQGSATYAITLPASTIVTKGGGVNMTVDTFTSNPSGTGALSGGGSQNLTVGATLNVAASQATGTYTGTFDVTVTYN
jgi:hypothetical protein